MSIFFWRKKPRDNVTAELTSPSGRVLAHFYLKSGALSYDLSFNNQTILRESRLGIRVAGEPALSGNFVLVRSREQEKDESWTPAVGEEAEIRNHYREYAFYLAERPSRAGRSGSGNRTNGSGRPVPARLLTLRFRLFDDALAFRYEIPPQPGLVNLSITDERTEFAVDYNASAYSIPAFQPDRYEYDYHKHYIYEIDRPAHTPFTIRDPSGHFLSIHEAALYDYGEMTMQFDGVRALRTNITPLSDGTKAHVELPWSTPWRLVMLGENELDLTKNRAMLNLNEPPRQDFGWVQPLKFLGIWWAMYVGEWTWAPGERHGATTEHAREYIDACKRLGIPGLLIEGWNNGWDGDWLQNGATSDFLHPEGDFDLDYIAAYADQKGVKLVGHHETVGFVDNYERQLTQAYKYYSERGVRYIKSGYAGSMMTIHGHKEWHHSQLGVRHYQKALELAAQYQICLNVHEPIKGTGIERTWPNLLTREGARGQEYEGGALSPSHACYLPFTRLLSGGMDYTSGILDVTNQNKRCASTLARQLAYYVTIFSGMQMAADRPRFYEEVQADAARFIREVPVNWQRTVSLLGEIGQFYVVARQGRKSDDGENSENNDQYASNKNKGDRHVVGENDGDWYIGGVTNEDGRRVRLRLDFLDPDKDYRATIYRDGEDAHYRDNQLSIVIEEKILRAGDYLDVYMAPGGGFAVRIRG